MKRLGLASVLAGALFLGGGRVVAEPAENPEGVEILQKYLDATEQQKSKVSGLTMETEIEAKLPRLHSEGKLSALRHISRIGPITYNALKYTGDNIVKKEVIARFLDAEKQAGTKPGEMAINQENYKFKYKGLASREGHDVYVFELKPKKKRVGLFKGEMWIDPETYFAVHESGTLVKSPSMFLKKIAFVRSYTIQDGMALLSKVDTVIETRIVGKAELSVRYFGYRQAADGEQASIAGTGGGQ